MNNPTEIPRLCTTCKFCASKDYGYSNYTVEGTGLYCIQKVNVELDGYERPWSIISGRGAPTVESVIRVAETCRLYVEGDGPAFDVDGYTTKESYKDNPEVYAVLESFDF